MRRLLVILAILGLLFSFTAVSAETIAAENLIETDDFTLAIGPNVTYQLLDKTLQRDYLQVFPYNDTDSIGFAWSEPFTMSAAIMKEYLPLLEVQYNKELEPLGVKAVNVVCNDPVNSTLDGHACVYFDYSMNMVKGEASVPMYQRQYYVGNPGYIITITSTDEAHRDEMAQILTSSITWK